MYAVVTPAGSNIASRPAASWSSSAWRATPDASVTFDRVLLIGDGDGGDGRDAHR